MTRTDAGKINVGDKVIYREFYVFKVMEIKYVNPKDTKNTSIMFVDKEGTLYNYKYCRRWENKVI